MYHHYPQHPGVILLMQDLSVLGIENYFIVSTYGYTQTLPTHSVVVNWPLSLEGIVDPVTMITVIMMQTELGLQYNWVAWS